MKIDKWFSIFLSNNELDHEIPNTPEWKEYKTKMVEYRKISDELNVVKYKLKGL